jgi:hypothetical protein
MLSRPFGWTVLLAVYALSACGGASAPSAESQQPNPFAQALAVTPSQEGSTTQPDSPAHPQGDPFKAFVQTRGQEVSR